MTALGRLDFIVDEQIRPFIRNKRADLLASDTEVVGAGQYVILKNRVKKGTVEIIKAIIPYAQRRTDVATGTESFESILPVEGDGHFVFTPMVNSQPLFMSEIDFNAPRLANGTLKNEDRQKRSGLSGLSASPEADALRAPPSWFALKLVSDSELVVTFEILPAANTSPLTSGRFLVDRDAPSDRRVDFAGVVITGVVMPTQTYDNIVSAEQANNAPPPSSGGGGPGICR